MRDSKTRAGRACVDRKKRRCSLVSLVSHGSHCATLFWEKLVLLANSYGEHIENRHVAGGAAEAIDEIDRCPARGAALAEERSWRNPEARGRERQNPPAGGGSLLCATTLALGARSRVKRHFHATWNATHTKRTEDYFAASSVFVRLVISSAVTAEHAGERSPGHGCWPVYCSPSRACKIVGASIFDG